MSLRLIKNAEIFAPKPLGKKDLLIAGGQISYIAPTIDIPNNTLPVDIIDAKDHYLFPGFIDGHVHILGGGGEGGFKTRTPELPLSDLIRGGITTVVGCRGTDGVSRGMSDLLAKARALDEEGITTFIYTGSYEIPVKTLTQSIQTDVINIDKIIGVGECAISDHRSTAPTLHELKKIASEARIAGILSGKCGIVNLHLGDGKDKLSMLRKLINESDIPYSQFVPTHMGRSKELFEDGIKYALEGGYIDFTTSTTKEILQKYGEVKSSTALQICLSHGVDISKITFTSDGNGSLPSFDQKGVLKSLSVASVTSLYKEVKDAILKEDIPIEKALSVITKNPANVLKLGKKGEIKVSNDADINLVNKNTLEISTVISRGEVLMKDATLLRMGTFES